MNSRRACKRCGHEAFGDDIAPRMVLENEAYVYENRCRDRRACDRRRAVLDEYRTATAR